MWGGWEAERANARHPAVTSVERGGAVDVSSDEGGLLFPHGVVPHPPDPTLRGEERSGRQRSGRRRKKKIQIEAGKDRMGKERKREEEEEAKIKVGERIKGRNHNEGR